MLKMFGIVCVLILSVSANAATLLVENAEVTRVTNSANNTDTFTISTVGGTGLCASTPISFPAQSVSHQEIHKRAFAIALAANATGKKVRIYNYVNQECNGAGYIELSN